MPRISINDALDIIDEVEEDIKPVSHYEDDERYDDYLDYKNPQPENDPFDREYEDLSYFDYMYDNPDLYGD